MLIKNAYIVKMRMLEEYCIHYKDYDYMLKLSEKQYKDFIETGFPAKKVIHPKNGVSYWIRVQPLQIDPYIGKSFDILEEFENRFLYRKDIDIDFHIGKTTIRDRIFKRLYFTSVNIINKKAQA